MLASPPTTAAETDDTIAFSSKLLKNKYLHLAYRPAVVVGEDANNGEGEAWYLASEGIKFRTLMGGYSAVAGVPANNSGGDR